MGHNLTQAIDSFADGRLLLRLANDRETREKAYRLIYRLYREKGYALPKASGRWLSHFDADASTMTFFVERVEDQAVVGALTVLVDSEAGLPSDECFRPELEALRGRHRRLCEMVSFGIDEKTSDGALIMVRLANAAYITARYRHQATDVLIAVHPRHVDPWIMTMPFDILGEERAYEKVSGAPAVLLRCKTAACAERLKMAHSGLSIHTGLSQSMLSQFYPPTREAALFDVMSSQAHPMGDEEKAFFFGSEVTTVRVATPRAFDGCGPRSRLSKRDGMRDQMGGVSHEKKSRIDSAKGGV
jgi:hypothetical protein